MEERIGRGGMGVVYRGHHLKLPREVAIKSISAASQRDLRRLRSRFEKEAFIQSQLDHQGIVKIYDYIVAADTYYIVMEFVEGRSLAQLLEREVCPLPVDRALDLFEQVLDAMAYAQQFVYQDQDGSSHRGLIHRDLKPANMLITPADRVKITDFGIVKLAGTEKTNTGANYGSPEYVSPEQAEGAHVDLRSDIYSLGVILYEMLTGTPPFHDEGGRLSQLDIVRAHIHQPPRPPSELNQQVTPELEAVILRALEKRRENRFASAAEFLSAVRRARGREAAVPVAGVDGGRTARASAGTQELIAPTVPEVARETYSTQPVNAQSYGPDDASATVNLTRAEAREWRRQRSFGAILGGATALVALVVIIIYVAGRGGGVPVEKPVAQPQLTPVEPAALVEVRAARVAVDSSYEGYSAGPLTDGELDVRRIGAMRYNEGNWASAETPVAHWVEFNFERPVHLGAVYVYWGFDRARFMPSRRVELQVAEDGEWRTVSTMEPDKNYDRTAFEFAPVRVTRARILQPPRQGPQGRPFIMWLREVKVFGVAR
ncbi:MAG TPA: protein kinase [Pyrinomonadaceae bacterium]|nr:protein kinase [Pyrinomonadaceae bacterium]